MLNRLAVSAVLLALPAVCTAHRDTLIPIESDGTLARLPKQYQPANVEIRFERGEDSQGVSYVRLKVGAKEVSLPICLIYVLNSEQISQVRAMASWYHEDGSLPPYLDLEFFDPGYDVDRDNNPGYSLLFNLDTAQLLKMDVNIVRDNGKSIQSLPVDVRELCPANEAAKLGK